MRMTIFAKRCAKEILRDPLNLAFGLGFPLVLMVLLSAMQKNIPAALFEIDTLTPGMTVFGLSFFTLFSATLIARDRESAFLQRLYTTPLTGVDFILGYLLPLLPMALGQAAISIHGGVLYVSYLATYLLNDWLEWGPVPILVFTGIFLLGYVAVWVVIYATTKRKTDRLNEIFREKQNGMKNR